MKIGRCRLLESPYPARDEAFFVLYAIGSPSFFIIMAHFFAVTRGDKIMEKLRQRQKCGILNYIKITGEHCYDLCRIYAAC